MLTRAAVETHGRFLLELGVGVVGASLLLGLAVQTGSSPAGGRPGDVALRAQSRVTTAGPTQDARAAGDMPLAPATTTPPTHNPSPTTTAPVAALPPARAPVGAAANPLDTRRSADPASPARRPAATTTPSRPRLHPSGPTSWSALNAAIARIPGYRPGSIEWSVTTRYGHYGTTDLATAQIHISPHVPLSLLDSVVRHEYAHVLSVRAYGGRWRTTVSALNAAFGGTGNQGVERAADCMALELGASWTHHTSCTSSAWRTMARHLLAGRPA